MFTKPKIRIIALGILAGFALFAPVASAAPANGFGVTFAKKSSHTSFGFAFATGAGFWHPTPPSHVVACAPAVWVPAHYETVLEKVWIEGQQQNVWCGPAYAWQPDACGHLHKVLITPGHWNVVCTPGHYESRRVQVLEPGHWQSAGQYAD